MVNGRILTRACVQLREAKPTTLEDGQPEWPLRSPGWFPWRPTHGTDALNRISAVIRSHEDLPGDGPRIASLLCPSVAVLPCRRARAPAFVQANATPIVPDLAIRYGCDARSIHSRTPLERGGLPMPVSVLREGCSKPLRVREFRDRCSEARRSRLPIVPLHTTPGRRPPHRPVAPPRCNDRGCVLPGPRGVGRFDSWGSGSAPSLA